MDCLIQAISQHLQQRFHREIAAEVIVIEQPQLTIKPSQYGPVHEFVVKSQLDNGTVIHHIADNGSKLDVTSSAYVPTWDDPYRYLGEAIIDTVDPDSLKLLDDLIAKWLPNNDQQAGSYFIFDKALVCVRGQIL
jgi:hypothetical protein